MASNTNPEAQMDFIVTSTVTMESYRYDNRLRASTVAGILMALADGTPGSVIEIRSIVSGTVISRMVARWVNYGGRWIPQH